MKIKFDNFWKVLGPMRYAFSYDIKSDAERHNLGLGIYKNSKRRPNTFTPIQLDIAFTGELTAKVLATVFREFADRLDKLERTGR